MKDSPFIQKFEQLPPTVALFPLQGVLLLPAGNLPLNIFEQRYLNMIDDAMRTDRLIGIIQPLQSNNPPAQNERPELQKIGCVGRITAYNETEDGRFIINVTGLYRFEVESEIDTNRGYRRAHVNWQNFHDDLSYDDDEEFLDREQLMPALKKYFCKEGLMCSWEAIETTNDFRLVTLLSMICPFPPQEKQLLLEAPTPCERAKTLLTLLEMESALNCPQQHH